MSHVTGLLVIDAPASALNNAGADTEARTDNAVAVKFIRAPEGRYPYVSAQAVRYWLRTQLALEKGWAASPVFRETKVAYTDAEPIRYVEDDLFGYMRAASKSRDEKKAAKRAEIAETATPVDEETGEVTRVSPFRVGTLVSTAPVRITGDFGTMARAEGDPVPHEHQFYRAHLKAPLALDLTCAGTFFCSKRVGFKNLDANRIESARKAGATQVKVRGFDAWRMPLDVRRRRAATLLRALGRLEGGAKQTLHLTDTAPSVLVLAACRCAAQPFQRLFNRGDLDQTVFRTDVLAEALAVFKDDLLSDVYLGWAKGFLDGERRKLDVILADGESNAGDAELKSHRAAIRDQLVKLGRKIVVGHPREIADRFADLIVSDATKEWFA
jgi:CRISPR-associated protein Cst2